mmetsp:Transcript_12010/g.8752  ORF Transcript_12010/g.8752 Transcript_12010/m.8752 type:complete len:108 (-) Transcript_12010:314-637(-)
MGFTVVLVEEGISSINEIDREVAYRRLLMYGANSMKWEEVEKSIREGGTVVKKEAMVEPSRVLIDSALFLHLTFEDASKNDLYENKEMLCHNSKRISKLSNLFNIPI